MSTPAPRPESVSQAAAAARRRDEAHAVRARRLVGIAVVVGVIVAGGYLYQWAVTEAPTAPAIADADNASTEAGTPGGAYHIDVNTADAAELQLLPGVGPTLAEAIIESRDARGPFRTVRDLERVHNIGAKRADGMAPYVRFGEPE